MDQIRITKVTYRSYEKSKFDNNLAIQVCLGGKANY